MYRLIGCKVVIIIFDRGVCLAIQQEPASPVREKDVFYGEGIGFCDVICVEETDERGRAWF